MDVRVTVETSEEITDSLKEVDELIVNREDILHRLRRMLCRRRWGNNGRQTPRRTPIPVNIVFPGEHG